MKKILYAIILIAASIASKAQTKSMDRKKKFNFMQHFHQTQNLNNQNQKFGLKINPYWQDVNAPHTYNSYYAKCKSTCLQLRMGNC